MKKYLLLAFAVATCFATAIAATDYGIEVNGTKVTSDKLSFSTGGGTVTYNASSCTLTLNNVIFSRSGEAIKVKYSTNRSALLSIVFNGTCLLTSTGSDAIVLEEGADLIVNSITQISTNGSGKYAIHIYNDEDADFDGSGSLLLEATDGYALGGQSGGYEMAYFKINACTLNGKRGNFYNLKKVQIQPLSATVERSTIITLNPTKGGTYPHVKGVGEIALYNNVHIESPVGMIVNNLSSPTYYKETIIISDERDNPNYTQIGDYQYAVGTYNGHSVAKLMKPTVAYKQSQPTDAVIPGGVTIGGTFRPVYVNEYSLKDLKKLSRIRFAFGVMYIGSHFVDGCNNLHYFYLPSTVMEIASYAFYKSGVSGNTYTDFYWATTNPSNTVLTSTSIYGVNTLTARLFFPTLDAINIAKDNNYLSRYNTIADAPDLSAFDLYDNGNFFVATTGVFHEGSLGELALVGSSSDNTSVVLNSTKRTVLCGKPYACTSVAPMAYYGNTDITTVNISGSDIKEIGARAFNNCANLTTAHLSTATTTVGMAAFMGTGINALTIPANVKTLEGYAFSTDKLLSLTWNALNANDFSTSMAHPFETCANLRTITIGPNVERLPANLCKNMPLSKVNWNAKSMADFTGYNSAPFYNVSDNILTFDIGSSVEHIPAYLCYDMGSLSAVTLPSSLKSIGRFAFAYSGLTAVTIPGGVTSLGDSPFYGCENLRTVYFHAVSCNDMSEVDLNKGPFAGTVLSSFNIGNGVKRIPILLCYNQRGLNTISIPETVTEIGDLAFNGCSAIKWLRLPSKLTRIGQTAFGGCTGLTNIYPMMMNPAGVSYGNYSIFTGVDKETCKLTVPRGTLAAYKATMPWKEFFHIVQEGGTQGDVNGDGIVSGADVTALYNVLLDGAEVSGDADVNGDTVVSGADVTALYNLLLN